MASPVDYVNSWCTVINRSLSVFIRPLSFYPRALECGIHMFLASSGECSGRLVAPPLECIYVKYGCFVLRLADKIMGKVHHNTSKLAFKQMENINNFLVACEKYGIAKTDLFQTVDLFENQNLWQVVLAIFALGRKVSNTFILIRASQ